MTTLKRTPSEPIGTPHTDPLVDRGCVILDGICNCALPWEDCKYLKKKEEEK